MRFRSILYLLGALSLLSSLQLRGATPNEVPFLYHDGLLWLKVHVDGQREPLNFLLDSGASSSVLNIQTARRLNTKLGRQESVRGVNSKTFAFRIKGFEAEASGIRLPESLLALDLSGVSKTVHQPIDGLLGADFLRGRIVQVDFAARKIRILDNAQPSASSTVLPMKWNNDAICMPVGIAGNSPQWVRLDTGCDSALEWAPGGAMARRDPGTRDTSIGLSSASITYIRADVQLASHKLSGVEIGVHRQQIFSGERGLLGNGVLSQFRVTIDTPGRRVILDKN